MLSEKKPLLGLKRRLFPLKPQSIPDLWARKKKNPPLVNVRYLYQPGELEGGTKRATDPMWSLKVYQIERNVTKPDLLLPVLCYLSDGRKGGFIREELLAVPPTTLLPPVNAQ